MSTKPQFEPIQDVLISFFTTNYKDIISINENLSRKNVFLS